MKTVRIKIYKFKELSAKAQDKAITDHINFLIEIADENSFIWPIAEEMDRMQTPWFLASEIYHKHKEMVISEIEANDYDFKEDGKIY